MFPGREVRRGGGVSFPITGYALSWGRALRVW
jgi:hypothetical protein